MNRNGRRLMRLVMGGNQMKNEMSKLKHTPGPWWREDDEDSCCGAEIIFGRDETGELTEVARPMCPFYDGDLIAAAPQLAEALQEMAFQHYCGCGNLACNDCKRDAENKAALNAAGYDAPPIETIK